MYLKRNSYLAILALFLGDYKRQFYLREISRLAKLPLKTTQNLVNHLEKESILKGSVSGKNKYFNLNLGNIQTKLHLLKAEVYRTSCFINKYPNFNIFLKELKINEPVIVFGSFAKFKADKDSDLDLFLISGKKVSYPSHLLPYKIHSISLSEDEFIESLQKQQTLIKEIQENHIILNNHSFYIDTMWNYYGRN